MITTTNIRFAFRCMMLIYMMFILQVYCDDRISRIEEVIESSNKIEIASAVHENLNTTGSMNSYFGKDTRKYLAGVTSASKSVVAGLPSTVIAFTTYNVTVTAKDASGNNIGHGGDLFLIKITNK